GVSGCPNDVSNSDSRSHSVANGAGKIRGRSTDGMAAAEAIVSRSSSRPRFRCASVLTTGSPRSEEHTSELQSPYDLVCRLLLEIRLLPPCSTLFPYTTLFRSRSLGLPQRRE